jgi:hypothetical protein
MLEPTDTTVGLPKHLQRNLHLHEPRAPRADARLPRSEVLRHKDPA